MKTTTTLLALLTAAPLWAQQVQRPPVNAPRPRPQIAAPSRPAATSTNLTNGAVRGGEGGGTRGGGETIDLNGRPELRDLASNVGHSGPATMCACQ